MELGEYELGLELAALAIVIVAAFRRRPFGAPIGRVRLGRVRVGQRSVACELAQAIRAAPSKTVMFSRQSRTLPTDSVEKIALPPHTHNNKTNGPLQIAALTIKENLHSE